MEPIFTSGDTRKPLDKVDNRERERERERVRQKQRGRHTSSCCAYFFQSGTQQATNYIKNDLHTHTHTHNNVTSVSAGGFFFCLKLQKRLVSFGNRFFFFFCYCFWRPQTAFCIAPVFLRRP